MYIKEAIAAWLWAEDQGNTAAGETANRLEGKIAAVLALEVGAGVSLGEKIAAARRRLERWAGEDNGQETSEEDAASPEPQGPT
jgi:hypothetical protein